MTWSSYNSLFQSQRDGFFLYNALSNTLLKLDEAHYHAAEALRDGGDAAATGGGAAAATAGPLGDPEFLAVLREHLVIADRAEEESRLLAQRYERLARSFQTGTLALTVCPTLACNFRCPYCFEHDQGAGLAMGPETMERLVAFVKSFADARRLQVTWYGGEPTLAWDVVRELTEHFRGLGLAYESAGLVTNGYLLDEEKIAQLGELAITSVQITLDGPAEIHDTRRVLAGGGPTFARILDNVEALLASDFQGRCAIRVNVDRSNQTHFREIRSALLERFHDPRLSVYPGQVRSDLTRPFDVCGCLGVGGWADFTLGLYREEAVVPGRGFYPAPGPGCVANAHQGFVVGPAGELYKCWEDVGVADMAIGDIHAADPVTHPGLQARYAVGTDPSLEPACRECAALPICNGGCPNRRLRALQSGEEGLEFCSPYKTHLVPYLEAYYDTVLTREICAAVLSSEAPVSDERGWRVVSPQPRDLPTPDPLAGPIPEE